MRLIYRESKKEVKPGDKVSIGGKEYVIYAFAPPYKPSSSGKVTVKDETWYQEFYVGVIGAEWEGRDDQG